jgi:hypothetical protein
LVGADPGGESFVVEEFRDGLAETVGVRFGDPQFLPHGAPLLAEVVRVAKGLSGRGGTLMLR